MTPDYEHLALVVPEPDPVPDRWATLPVRRDTVVATLAIAALIAFVAWKVLGG